MKSTAHVNGHPIHPALIPYPFAFLTGGTVFDVAAAISGRSGWSQTAGHLNRAGLVAALVAAVPGIVDYFGSIPRRSSAKKKATYHALVNVSALACYAMAESTRTDSGPSRSGLLSSLAGTGLLSIGGWLGGELVYHEHVAVEESPSHALVASRLDAADL